MHQVRNHFIDCGRGIGRKIVENSLLPPLLHIFSGHFLLGPVHGHLPLGDPYHAAFLQLPDGAVQSLYGDAGLLVNLFSGPADDAGMILLDVLEKVEKEQVLGRVEQPVAPVVGGTVQLICHFLRDQAQKVNIFFNPVFKIFSGKIQDGAVRRCLNRDGGTRLPGKDRHLAHEIYRIISFVHGKSVLSIIS